MSSLDDILTSVEEERSKRIVAEAASRNPRAQEIIRNNQVLQKDANTSSVSRFAKLVPENLYKATFEPIMRGAVSTKQSMVEILSGQKPAPEPGSPLVGNKPVRGLAEYGAEIVSDFGASEQTARKYGTVVGPIFAGLDMVPGGFEAKKGAEIGIKTIQKLTKATTPEVVATLLRTLGFEERSIVREAVVAGRKASDYTDFVKQLVRTTDEAQIAKALDNEVSSVRSTLKSVGPATESVPPARQSDPQVALKTARNAEGATIPTSQVKPIVREATQQVPTEEGRLLDRMLSMAEQSGKAGVREGKAIEKIASATNRKEAVKLAKLLLDKPTLARFTQRITEVRTKTQLQNIIQKFIPEAKRIADERNAIRNLLQTRKEIGFFKKELMSRGASERLMIRSAMDTLGFNGSPRDLTIEQLKQVKEELGKRLREGIRYDREQSAEMVARGVDLGTPPTRDTVAGKPIKFASADKQSDIGRIVSNVIEDISSGLEKISPKLKGFVRESFSAFTRKHERDITRANPFFGKFVKASPEIQGEFSILAMSGNMDEARMVAEEGGFVKEFDDMKQLLDNLFEEATTAGIPVNYRKGFWPRSVFDRDGLLKFMHQNYGNEMAQVLDEWAKKRGLPNIESIPEDEVANITNSLLMGHRHIKFPDGSELKAARQIPNLVPEMAQYYEDAATSLGRYITDVHRQVQFYEDFGKKGKAWKGFTDDTTEVNEIADLGIQVNNADEIADSLGAVVMHLAKTDQIGWHEIDRVKELLTAAYAPKGPGGLMRSIQSFGYVSLLSNPMSALRNIGDIGMSLYQNGLLFGLKGIAKREVRLEDLGIGLEKVDLAQIGRMTDNFMKWSGFKFFDRLGKETYVNGALLRLRDQATSSADELAKRLKTNGLLTEETIPKVIEDLRSGTMTDDVKTLLFSELSEVQPISILEMPKQYATGGNGRIFYMMKTFQRKQMQAIVNELRRDMKSGNTASALAKTGTLVAFLTTAQASADYIVQILQGKDPEPTDLFVDNMLKLSVIGSKYTANDVLQAGVSSAVAGAITPAATPVVDNLIKDAKGIYDGNFEFRTSRNIPVVGAPMYYWFFKDTNDSGAKSSSLDSILGEYKGKNGGSLDEILKNR